MFPALKVRYLPSEKTCQKTWETKLPQFGLYSLFHLFHRDIRHRELSIQKAVRAVHGAPRAIGVGTPAQFIALQRHAARLAVLEDPICVHKFSTPDENF